MKKQSTLFGAMLLLSPALGLTASLMVEVQQAQLRSEPSFLSKIITNVGYHNLVNVIGEQGAWRQVSFKQQQGWMHISALLSSTLKLTAGKDEKSSVSAKEVSLAGKGFNAAVEKDFKKNHPKISFVWVNYMEKINIPASELEKFAASSDFSTASR